MSEDGLRCWGDSLLERIWTLSSGESFGELYLSCHKEFCGLWYPIDAYKTFDHRQFTGWIARSFTDFARTATTTWPRRDSQTASCANRIGPIACSTRARWTKTKKKNWLIWLTRVLEIRRTFLPSRQVNENERREASRSTRVPTRWYHYHKEHRETYMLSGDGVAPVLTNRGQLFVRRRRCIGKPYRPVQSICTAVHDEFQLHPTTLNLETLLPGFVSQGNTTFIDCFLSNHDSIRPYCSSAQRFFGERFGRLLFEEKTISPSLVRTWTIIHAEIFWDQQGLGHLCRSTFLSANVHSAADRFPSFCSFVGSFPSFHLIFRILSFHQNVLLFSASSAYFPSRSTMISEVHGASLDHRQWRAELPRDRAILRTLRRSCCTISWCQLSRVAGAFPRVRNPATWGTETAKRRRTRPRIPSPHLGCNASCYYFPWEF